MYHLERFEIDGFWKKWKLSSDLNSDVTIFIGKNGTGKTTLKFLPNLLKNDNVMWQFCQ